MHTQQLISLAILCLFYTAYLTKAVILRRKGITVNQLGKGTKPEKARQFELLLRAATLLGGIIQFLSVLFPSFTAIASPSFALWLTGTLLALLGTSIFIAAMATMQTNWRAGFSEGEHTNLVTHGIYVISRNPAFVGFDLFYIGCALASPTWPNLAAAVATVFLFHVQILGEEKYLRKTFAEAYQRYERRVNRYLGRRAM